MLTKLRIHVYLFFAICLASLGVLNPTVRAENIVPDNVVFIGWVEDDDPSTPGHQLVLLISLGGDESDLQGTFSIYESTTVPSSGPSIGDLSIDRAGENLLFSSLTNVGVATRFSVKFVSNNATYSDTNIENIRPLCIEGSYSANGYGPCNLSPAGSVVPRTGAINPVPCSPGYYQPEVGQMFCYEAPPGRYVPGFGATTSILCGMGTYTEFTRSAFCDPAPIGYFINELGSTAAFECEPRYTTPIIGSSICQLDQNTLVSTPTAIWNSPTGGTVEMSFSVSPLVSGTLTVYQSSHIAGSPRIAGTASIASGASTANINLNFDETTSSDSYSIKFESNNSNHNTTYWEMVSPLCGPGNYSNNGFTPCTASPAGTFITGTGNTAPTDCAPGTYQPSVRQSSCLNAPAGTYVATAGASTPTTCPSGYFSADIAATSSSVCTASNPGNFVDDNDHSRQQPCAKGTFQKNVAQSACVPAKIGYFVNTEGASKQKRCKRGYTTSSTGSTSCKLKPKEPRLPTSLSRTRISTVYLKNGITSDGLRVVLKTRSKTCKISRSTAGYKITGKKKGKCAISLTIKGNRKFASVTRTRNIRVA